MERGQIPSKYRGLYGRAMAGKSLRAAVNAQCLDCCGWQSKEVAECSDTGCPLYAVRPVKTAQDFSGSAPDGHFTEQGDANGGQRVSSSQGVLFPHLTYDEEYGLGLSFVG